MKSGSRGVNDGGICICVFIYIELEILERVERKTGGGSWVCGPLGERYNWRSL